MFDKGRSEREPVGTPNLRSVPVEARTKVEAARKVSGLDLANVEDMYWILDNRHSHKTDQFKDGNCHYFLRNPRSIKDAWFVCLVGDTLTKDNAFWHDDDWHDYNQVVIRAPKLPKD